MKNLLKLTSVAFFILFALVTKANTSGTEDEVVKIKTSAVCDMCKQKIEDRLRYEKGVQKVTLDVKTKIVTVVYKKDKTNADKIRTAISKIGYDADDVKANSKAYKKLDNCCQKTPSSKKCCSKSCSK